MKTSLEAWAAALLTTLGLPPIVGCGGSTSSQATEHTEQTFPCVNPKPLGGGFVDCNGQFVDRMIVEDCPEPPAPIACASGSTCQIDSDCPGEGYKRCLAGAANVCSCWYGCHNDADCGSGSVCKCGSEIMGVPIGVCTRATCSSNADCHGLLCATGAMSPVSGCGSGGYFCQSSTDQCMSDSDCDAGQCFVESSQRVCEVRPCVTGRPFIVSESSRTAAPIRTSTWCEDRPLPSVEQLSRAERLELAREWTRTGLMEHASIAAFARFTMQLLALGAPPDLIEASTSAARDETEHARLAFTLASAYADRPTGPGPLDTQGALEAVEPSVVVADALTGGCVNETIAAIEALEALAHATDPAVRAALTRIAHDESRHAYLAWRFVAWALRGQNPDLRAAAHSALAELVRANSILPNLPITHASSRAAIHRHAGSSSLLAHGVLPETLRREVTERVIREVVVPCAAELLAQAERIAAAVRRVHDAVA